MMSSELSSQWKRPIERLSKSDWQQVFTDLRLWLESKAIFYVCQFDNEQSFFINQFLVRVASGNEVLAANFAALHNSKDKKEELSPAESSSIQSHERSI